MRKIGLLCALIIMLTFCLFGCSNRQVPKIGVSLGVGSSPRWAQEKIYMEERAKELDAEITVHLSEVFEGTSQKQDCIDLINSGIDVLIMRPKDTKGIEEVIKLAKQKNVKIINYASLLENQPVDLFVGYDCTQIGQSQGQFLAEMVTSGDYILLSGDSNDKFVSSFLYDGAMKYINPIKSEINVILDASVPGWKPEEAKAMVREAIVENGNKVDAILAPNDGIAGACAEVISELGITQPVVITGMDADLAAVKRIIDGTQSCTVYMDGKMLANTAVEEACKFARGDTVSVNAEIDNGCGEPIPVKYINSTPIPANLIAGKLIIKENIDRVLIESNCYTRDQVYGDN